MKKACFLTGSFTFNAIKKIQLVFYDCFVRANAGASAATNA